MPPPARPRRGDVVAVRTTGTHVLFLKRIIALPGETVGIHRNLVIIDGRPLDEPYVAQSKYVWNLPPRRLGPDEFLVIGDNRTMPQEQHAFGVVRAGRILGRALL
jgi:signal peptidase I